LAVAAVVNTTTAFSMCHPCDMDTTVQNGIREKASTPRSNCCVVLARKYSTSTCRGDSVISLRLTGRIIGAEGYTLVGDIVDRMDLPVDDAVRPRIWVGKSLPAGLGQ
jgi:hypothetical protein